MHYRQQRDAAKRLSEAFKVEEPASTLQASAVQEASPEFTE
jgi:hypothetical protein